MTKIVESSQNLSKMPHNQRPNSILLYPEIKMKFGFQNQLRINDLGETKTKAPEQHIGVCIVDLKVEHANKCFIHRP